MSPYLPFLLALALAAGAPSNERVPASFVGGKVCSACHESGGVAACCSAQGPQAHARSYTALERPEARDIAYLSGAPAPPQQDPLCLGCHATGAEEGPRWQEETFRIEDGVQCEACHGPGSEHVRAARAGQVIARRKEHSRLSEAWLALSPAEELCRSCHLPRPSHREVLEKGYRRPDADLLYKTPVDLAVSPAGDRLFVAGERSNSILVVDPAAGRVLAEIPVDPRPQGVSVAPGGQRIFVTSRLAATVSAIDVAKGKVIGRASVGAEPHGIATDATGSRLFVLSTGASSVSVLDASDLAPRVTLSAGTAPWRAALRPDGKALYVTSSRPERAAFREPHRSEITIVDPVAGRVSERIEVPDASALRGIAFVPGRDVVLFTLQRVKDLVPMTRLAQGWVITSGLGVLWPDGRVDQVLLDDPADAFPDPTGLAVAPDGNHALVTSAGSDRVAVIDVAALLELLLESRADGRARELPDRLGTSARFVVRRVAVGRNPRGVAFSPDGRFAYVAAAMDDAINVLETRGFTVQATIPLGGPSSVTETRRGERLFQSAASTFGRQFSCASCHPEGHLTGLALDIEADGIGLKPEDVRSLRGVFDTPPFKWLGTNPSLERQCGPRLAIFFTRTDPTSGEDLSGLVRFVATLEQPPNPLHSSRGQTLAQRRGKEIFDRKVNNRGMAIPPALRCVNCHSGPYKTSLRSAGVGTQMRLDRPTGEPSGVDPLLYLSQDEDELYDNPHLRGIAGSAPYLHNGAAATLEEIWTRFNLYEWHGVTRDLTPEQFGDMIEYLKSL